jgi:hypothetical protein
VEVTTLEDPGNVPTADGGRIPVRYKDYVDVFKKDMAETLVTTPVPTRQPGYCKCIFLAPIENSSSDHIET